MVWIYSWRKHWEGRTQTAVLSRLHRMLTAGDTILLLAGSTASVHCTIQEVRPVGGTAADIRTVVTHTNWRLFVPWVATHADAVATYAAMSDGSGFVFMRLAYPHSVRGLGH